MTVDVACVGHPFLDLIFRGLTAIPEPGEEELAEELAIVPGAIANVAFALRQLGLDAVVCAPVGRDPAGRLLRELMDDAGVPWVGRPTDRTPVSVALPVRGDRAFVTAAAPPVVDFETLAGLSPRAIVADLPNVPHLPPGPVVYAVLGDPEVRALVGRLPESLSHLRALILNHREARLLTGAADESAAAGQLAALGTTVVVTCGAEGAFATAPDGRVTRVSAPQVHVRDPTGAGDLFTAAFVWSDLEKRSTAESLTTAATYASLSLATAGPTRQKGITRQELESARAAGSEGDAPVVDRSAGARPGV